MGERLGGDRDASHALLRGRKQTESHIHPDTMIAATTKHFIDPRKKGSFTNSPTVTRWFNSDYCSSPVPVKWRRALPHEWLLLLTCTHDLLGAVPYSSPMLDLAAEAKEVRDEEER